MFILGVCVCNTGFIGFDCSMTLSEAPTELTIPNKGLCSTKTRLCQKTNIFSVFYSEKVHCRFQHFTVRQLNKYIFGFDSGIVLAVSQLIYLFIYSFIYLLLFLIVFCSINCVTYHEYREVIRSYFYSTYKRD